MPSTPPDSYRISDLAREFGITTRTIRFYEDQGLLKPQREGRRRVYGRRDRTRLKLTLRGKRLGLALSEIKEILDLFDSPKGEEAQLRYFLDVLNRHRNALEQQRADIEAILSELDAARSECLRRLAAIDPLLLSSG